MEKEMLHLLGVYGAYVMAMVMAIVLSLQIRTIITERSVKSLSTAWVIFFTVMFASGIVYGLRKPDLTIMICNIVLTLFNAVILGCIARYRGLRSMEIGFGFLLLMLAGLMVVAPEWQLEAWLIAWSTGGVMLLLKQCHDLAKAQDVGAVNPWMIVGYIVTNIFWVTYAYTGTDRALWIICPSNLVTGLLFLAVWIYRRRNPKPTRVIS